MKELKAKARSLTKKTFILKNIGHKYGEIYEFGQQLISNLGNDVFHFQNRQVFLFNVLNQITPVNKKLKLDDNSIESACEIINTHFKLNFDKKTNLPKFKKFNATNSSKQINTEIFCQSVIGIDKVPAHAFEKLSSKVNTDLNEISELIKWYELNPFIQKYINDNEIPKSHEDRVVFDFYKRCIIERINIVNYQLYNLKDRAIAKSRYSPDWLNGVWSFADKYNDRPYHFARPNSIHYFDCRKIDLVGHRIIEYYIDEEKVMQELYKANPYKFYRIYFKKNKVEQHFQNFKFYLSYLPLSKNRNLIFDELIKLFKAKRWISFYALALPQIEGLFSEMCSVVTPEKDFSQKSLPHKVNSLRPFHYASISFFDYYQYHIPIQRNRFAHTGFDEDFKLKSYDTLVDLSHLLQVFYELDNPLVKIKQLITRSNFEDFISVREFVDYFKLIDSLKSNQKNTIKIDIEKFEKDFLCKECSLDFTCYEMIQDLPLQVRFITDIINESFTIQKKEIQFEKLNKPDLDILFKDEVLFEILKNIIINNTDKLERIVAYSSFIHSQKKHLPSLRQEIKMNLSKLNTEFGEILKNLSYTVLKIQNLNDTV